MGEKDEKIGVVSFSMDFYGPGEKGLRMQPLSGEAGMVTFTDWSELRKVMHKEVDRMIDEKA